MPLAVFCFRLQKRPVTPGFGGGHGCSRFDSLTKEKPSCPLVSCRSRFRPTTGLSCPKVPFMKQLNLGILAHVDAGKTSLTERLLYTTGVIDRMGSVDAGNTQRLGASSDATMWSAIRASSSRTS